MRPSEVGGIDRPVPDCCTVGAQINTSPSGSHASAAARNPLEAMPSSLVIRMSGLVMASDNTSETSQSQALDIYPQGI
jgi:hypothetical protein